MSIFIFLKNAFEFFLYLIWSTLSLAYGTYITTQAFLNCLFLYRSVFKWFLILDTFMLRPASSVLQYFAIVSISVSDVSILYTHISVFLLFPPFPVFWIFSLFNGQTKIVSYKHLNMCTIQANATTWVHAI